VRAGAFALVIGVGFLASVRGQVPPPGVPPATIANPDLHIRAAAAYVATAEDFKSPDGKLVKGHGAFITEDMCHIRFVSFWNVDEKYLPTVRCLFNWWIQQMSFNTHVELPKEVPGTSGRLLWLDLRDYKWNAAAWQAVTERERYICEPWVDHEQAEYLRRRLVAPLSSKASKGREVAEGAGKVRTELILPAGTVVSGIQFLRDTLETDRTPSYYDLLFAEFRYKGVSVEGGAVERPTTAVVPANGSFWRDGGDGKAYQLRAGESFPIGVRILQWKGNKWHDYKVPEAVQRELPQGKIESTFTNFPANLDDWEKAFGVDKVREHMRERKIDLDFGSIVDGGEDVPGKGSMVALRNRLLVTVVGPTGAHMETFDVLEASGIKDFSEATIFGGKKFRAGRGAVAKRDAGEILTYLPNGGQAALLIDANNNRVETAGNNIALDGGATGMDRRVRNAGSCVVCHAPSGGWIPPNDVIREGLEKGVRYKFKDREQENRFKGFIVDQSKRMKAYTEPYLDLVEKTTRKDSKGKGWTGAQLAKEVEGFRRYYDQPLDLKTAAAEVGMPEADLAGLLVKMPFNRGQRLARGLVVPRRTWEVDLYPNVQILRQAEMDTKKK
jgi:hypothetical protein